MAQKTNAMRILESKKLDYKEHTFDPSIGTDGVLIAKTIGFDPNKVFKTLVTVSKSGEYFVFMVPVCKELDLKKAAKSVSQKSIAMIKQKDLLPLTGYIHGGCSPIGMKKFFTTTIDKSAQDFDTIIFSGGERGKQIEMSLDNLKKAIRISVDDIVGQAS